MKDRVIIFCSALGVWVWGGGAWRLYEVLKSAVSKRQSVDLVEPPGLVVI